MPAILGKRRRESEKQAEKCPSMLLHAKEEMPDETG
jgi:hypothetical protein